MPFPARFLLFFLALICLAPATRAQEPEQYVSVRLIADKATVAPGETVTVGLEQTIYPEWHTYWVNPGDSGAATTLSWILPAGFTAGEINWPVPKKLPFGPLVNYGYEGTAVLLQDITAPAELPEGPLTLRVTADILVCHDICIPETHMATLTLNGGGAAQPAVINAARTRLPAEAGWETGFREESGELILTIAGEDSKIVGADAEFFPEEWGIIDNTATAATEKAGAGLVLRQKRGERALGEVPVFKGVIAYTDPQGERKGVRLSALLKDAPPASTAPHVLPILPAWQAILFAVLGGLILNLMPCVFPVLSMKALSLVKLKDEDEDTARKHGLAYAAGVIASFGIVAAILLALKAAGEQIGWGFQLQHPAIVMALAYLLFAIGLNLSGFFELGGRFASIGDTLTRRGGLAGSFFTGVLATLVATPCTAPFMGAATGVILTQGAAVSMAVFLFLGLGLALPYLALTFVPALRHLLPRPGAWMETFRQFLAFPMFASAAWMVWVLSQQTDPMGVFAALLGMTAIAFAIWLLRKAPTQNPGHVITVVLALAALTFAAFTLFMPMPRTGIAPATVQQNWEVYSEAHLNEILAEPYPVFVNMTAAWCITCKVNEKVALDTESTRAMFAEKKIRYLKGDWTNQNPEITKFLSAYGRSGVPLYVYYAPPAEASGERPEPLVLPQILTPRIVKDAIQNP